MPVGDTFTTDPQWDGDAVTFDAAFFARGEEGGGLSYKAYAVRLCVTYRVLPSAAEVAGVECGPDVPTHRDNVGTIDETVTLDE